MRAARALCAEQGQRKGWEQGLTHCGLTTPQTERREEVPIHS